MDEEDMDDKEEQSEESRAVKVGQKKMMTPTLAEREAHIPFYMFVPALFIVIPFSC